MLVAVSFALVAACGRAGPSATGGALVPVARFVDQAASGNRSALVDLAYAVYRRLGGGRPLRTAHLPSATIGGETRYVLVGPPYAAEKLSVAAATRADGGAVVSVALPDAFVHSRRALVRVATRTGNRWSPIVHSTLPVAAGADGRPVMTVAASAAEGSVAEPMEEISVEAFGESKGLLAHRTARLRVPDGGRLDFGTGIVAGAGHGESVAFTVSACVGEACTEVFRDVVTSGSATADRWRDHVVSLEALSGKDVVFEFRAEVTAAAPDALVLPVWSNPTVYAPLGSRRPSVILVSLDTLRADRLPTYGYTRDTAPFLDAMFGKDGTVLEDCMSASASTPPGHMTIMTSLDPSVHGVRRGDETLDPIIATLAEVLRADGVTTGAVTENGWLVHGQGFGRGFDSYAEDKALDLESPQGAIERTLAAALRWIERRRDTPFFLFVHTYQVHDPYVPPPEYAELFAVPGMPDSDSLRYDREIRYTDDILRRFFAELRTLLDAESTIVIVTSDHGEGFQEHGYSLHSSFLYQEIVHVPCMLWGAGIPQGRRVSAPVGTIDLAPTIARLAGAPRPRQFAGVDLAPLITGDDAKLDAELRSRLLFSEAWGDVAVSGEQRQLTAVVAPGLAVRRDGVKLLRTTTPDAVLYEAYDLGADSAERKNLMIGAGEPATAVTAELRSAIDRYLADAKQARARLLGVAVDDLPPDRPAGGTVAPDTENKLRALGYLE